MLFLTLNLFLAWTGVKEEKSELYEEEHLKRLHRKNTKENYCGPWQCYVCGQIHETVILVNDHITKTHFPIVKSSMFGPPRDHQCATIYYSSVPERKLVNSTLAKIL